LASELELLKVVDYFKDLLNRMLSDRVGLIQVKKIKDPIIKNLLLEILNNLTERGLISFQRCS